MTEEMAAAANGARIVKPHRQADYKSKRNQHTRKTMFVTTIQLWARSRLPTVAKERRDREILSILIGQFVRPATKYLKPASCWSADWHKLDITELQSFCYTHRNRPRKSLSCSSYPQFNREEALTQTSLTKRARPYTKGGPMNCVSFPTIKRSCAGRLLFAVTVVTSALAINISDGSAMGIVPTATSVLRHDGEGAITPIVVRRGAVARRTTVVGPRGGVASRTVVRRGAVVRPGVVRPGAWVRPTWYRWAPGGAIAAGAALGFVTAATAVAWAGAPPAPGYCWYYTDASRQQGFWDACPR
jgi:hypothetical protein